MTDPFVPEADALEQQQEVTPPSASPDHDGRPAAGPALEYPERLPMEASEADVLEQSRTVEFDDDRDR